MKRFILPLILTILNINLCFAEQKLYWVDSTYSAPAIRCADSSGKSCLDKATPSNTVLLNLTPSLDYPGGLVIDEKNSKVIFTNGNTIETCSMVDGSGRNQTFITGQNTATHIAIDPVGERIYWTTFNGIFSAKLDGTDILPGPATSFNSFEGIAVDVAHSKIMWFEGYGNASKGLKIADLTSLSPMTYEYVSQYENLYGMTVNESTSRPMWVQYDQNTYMFANIKYYDGYNEGNVITNQFSGLSGTNSADYIGYNGIALDYPELNIYYGNSYLNTIYRTSLLTTPSQQTFISSAGEVRGLAFSCGKYATDTDNDKTADCREECPNDANKIAAGECGCGTSDADLDEDGTPDCIDNCDDDELKLEPGVCGCGEKEPTGACGCDLLEDINTDGKIVCVTNRQLAPNTKIENPPIVDVDGDTVTIILEKFTKPTLTLKKKKKKNSSSAYDYYDYSLEIKAGGLKIKYDIQISKVGGTKKDLQKLTSKRNELTVKNLTPGNYNVQYRAVITQNGVDAAKTKFSPAANFTIE